MVKQLPRLAMVLSTKATVQAVVSVLRLADIDSHLTGNEHDYLRLSLREGRVSLAVQLGSGSPFDTSIPRPDTDKERRKGVRFDDNEWHHVRVERRSSEVS